MVDIKESLKIIRNKLYGIKIDNIDLRKLTVTYTPSILQSAAYSTADYMKWFIQGLTWGAPVWVPKLYESIVYGDLSRLSQIADYVVQMPVEEWGTGAAGFFTSLATIGILKLLYSKPKK